MALIACLLVNYRIHEDTLACLRSLRDSDRSAFKVFLINNYGGDGSGKILEEFLANSEMEYAYFEPGANLGYTGGMNLGIKAALGEGIPTLLILNNDTVVSADFAAKARSAIHSHPDTVIAGLVLDAATGQVSHNIGRLSKWTAVPKDVIVGGIQTGIDFVSGCLMLVPAGVMRRIGPFDNRYFMYREDFDFCLRLKKNGIRIIHCPEIVVRHKVSSSADLSGTPKEYYRMRNQTHIILNRAAWHQKCLYCISTAVLLVYKTRHPRIFIQFLAAIRDALTGRLGPW